MRTLAAGVWAQLSWTDRLLSVWIIGAMGLGLILGKFTGDPPCSSADCTQHPHVPRPAAWPRCVHSLCECCCAPSAGLTLVVICSRHEQEAGHGQGRYGVAAHCAGSVAHDVAGADEGDAMHKGTRLVHAAPSVVVGAALPAVNLLLWQLVHIAMTCTPINGMTGLNLS